MVIETESCDVDTAQKPRSDRIAVVDVGSNSLRLVVAELCAGNDFRVLDEERVSTRLAQSLSSTGCIAPESMDDSLSVLRRFKEIASGFGVSQLRAIATCAVREAENGSLLCRRAKDEVGVPVRVISSEEEAQLAFLSIRKAYDLKDKNVAVADVGGASTEVVLASDGHIEAIYGLSVGAVRLKDDYLPGEQLTVSYEKMMHSLDRTLKRVIKDQPFVPHVLFGSGGTFTNLASMLCATEQGDFQPEWGDRISRAEVRHLLDRLQKMSLKQRRNVPGLNSDRADIIVPGLAIVDRLMRRLKVNVLRVHGRGVRDGLLWAMISEMQNVGEEFGDHTASVERFVESCGADLAHSRQVARLAGFLFEQLASPFHLRSHDLWILQSAALLQDVGYLINYDRHHKHSYHLILNSQLPGHSRHDLELIANVARYHRGAKPKKKHANFRKLSPADQQRVRQLAGILRLAGGLDRSHTQRVTSISARVAEGHTTIKVAARDDPEVDLWAASRRRRLFETVFQTKLTILPTGLS